MFFDASVNQTLETLEVIRGLGIQLVEDHLDGLKTGLEESAASCSKHLETGNATEPTAVLAGLPLPQDGINYWLATPDGTAADSDGNQVEWTGQLDLDPIFTEGKTAVIDPYFDPYGNYIFCIAAPVNAGANGNALLILRLDGFCLSRWIADIQFQTGEGVAYIANGNGRNIAASREENYEWITSLYNSQEIADTDAESKTVADVERQALEGKSGRGSYLWEGSRNYLVYAPMSETGWGFYVGFYGELINNYINDSAQRSLLSSLLFFLMILSFFLIIVFYANYNLKKERSYVKELLLQKKEIEKQAEDLTVNEERFRVALAQANNTIFEYDLQTGDITNFYATRVTHSSDSREDLKGSIVLNATIDDDSLFHLQRVLKDTHNGILNNECIIKAICSNETVVWYKVSITPLSNQQTRVIGIMEDITKEKEAELDPLTGLLNKKVITEQILSYLQNSEESVIYAFLMFDIDDFKNINDIYSHPVGDRVIYQTGMMLKKTFSSNSLVGRIGGDEFCVFCFDLPSSEQLENSLSSIYGQPAMMEGNIPITYSCGIVLYSESECLTFEELYSKADQALYMAKQKGKNQYCFYQETTETE